jgi:radical SAM superfamily enzyme YgiQ (UPF0313 family)
MIALINPPGFKSLSGLQTHAPNPPLGLAYVAGALKAAGLPYRVIDAAGEALHQIRAYPDRPDFLVQGLLPDEVIARIPAGTRAIGITCLFSSLWPVARDLAARARRRFPEAVLVLGGEHGTAVPEFVLDTSTFDVVVLGEGEETAVELFRAVLNGQPYRALPGIAYAEGGRIVTNGLSPRKKQVDEIAWPDWDSFPIEAYIAGDQMNGLNMGRSMPLLATRGCPYQCTFCSSPTMWTQRYLPRSPREVVDEIARYRSRYRISNVDFQDLTAIVNRKWALEFSRELTERDLGVTWQMPSGTRSEVFDEEVTAWLYRSGCRALSFAPESGDPGMLAKIKKQVDLDHMVSAIRSTVRQGFSLSCFFVIGFPEDTPGTLRNTLRLIRRLALLGIDEVSVAKFVPYPGSATFRRLCAEGKIALGDDFFISPMDMFSAKSRSWCDRVSARRLYWTMVWMYVNFFAISFLRRPLRPFRIIAKALLTGHEESRYAKWLLDRLYARRRWRREARHVEPAPEAGLERTRA